MARSRHEMEDRKLGGRAADAGSVVGWAHATRRAYRRRACLKRRWTGGSPTSTSSEVLGVALKAPRIHCAAECHTALMGRRPSSRGEKIEAP